MTIEFVLKMLLIGLIFFSIIFFLLGLARYDYTENIDEILKMYKEQKQKLRKEVDNNNKIIDELEYKIFKYTKRHK